MPQFDLIIRRGLILDGDGGSPFVADLAVRDGIIVAVRPDLAGEASEEIDATGLMVTPGFIDGHTHYDAQVVWDSALEPSASHGVTTAVMSNCGVGFAPVRSTERDQLIQMMEDVEDIPGTALHEGIQWEWESFPEYLDALDRRCYSIDIAAQIPHAPLRLYVMGDRGAANEPATADDVGKMSILVTEALEAGAIGFSTSRVLEHRSINGIPIPGTYAGQDELFAIAGSLVAAGRGVFQAVPRGVVGGRNVPDSSGQLSSEIDLLGSLALSAKVPVVYSLMQAPDEPDAWRAALAVTDRINRSGGKMRAMVGPRAPGQLSSWSGYHIFMQRPTYLQIANLPFGQQFAELQKKDVRDAILREDNVPTNVAGMMSNYHLILRQLLPEQYVYDTDMNFEPELGTASLGALARETGDNIEALAYDAMLRDNGRAQLSLIGMNYATGSYDEVAEMLTHPGTVIGLSDAGAHVRVICDAANTTFTLAFWGRDRRRGARIPVETLVRMNTAEIADLFGFRDRGRLKPGLRADINVIDFAALNLEQPYVASDLPSGGKRLLQGARGYVATFVKGVATRRNDRDTGSRPGKLVRDAGFHERSSAPIGALETTAT